MFSDTVLPHALKIPDCVVRVMEANVQSWCFISCQGRSLTYRG